MQPKYNIHTLYQEATHTPSNWNHKIGDFDVISIHDKYYGWVKIPKNASTQIKEEFNNNKHIGVVQADQQLDLQSLEWFAVIRDEKERKKSGYGSWVNTRREHNQPIYPIDEVRSNRDLWDEHIAPQEVFLKPFKMHGHKVRTFTLDSSNRQKLNNELSEYLGVQLNLH